MFDPKNAGKNVYAAVLILSVTTIFLVGSLNSGTVWPWFWGGLFVFAIGLPLLLLDIPAKWQQLDILKQRYDKDYYEEDLKEKNFRSLLTIIFGLLVLWIGFSKGGNFLPSFVVGMFIIFVLVPLQRIDNLLVHDGKLLGILKQWNELDEKGKIYRHLWVAFPTTVVVLFATKNPFVAGFYFVGEVWVGIRRLQKWQRLQIEERL